jgi:predicted  nucleic acid-binding Zn-ribbon protein
MCVWWYGRHSLYLTMSGTHTQILTLHAEVTTMQSEQKALEDALASMEGQQHELDQLLGELETKVAVKAQEAQASQPADAERER